MAMMTIVGAVKVDVGEEESGYGRDRGCGNHAHVIWGTVRFVIIANSRLPDMLKVIGRLVRLLVSHRQDERRSNYAYCDSYPDF
jgi:hypothetical protein